MVPWQIPIIFANWKKPWGQLKSTTKRSLQIVKKSEAKVGRRRGKDQRWDGWMVDTRIIKHLVWKPINLHLQLASWEGGRSNQWLEDHPS